MSNTDKYIVETYSSLFEGLSYLSKIELIESLSRSLKTDKTVKDSSFYKSFGTFSSEISAEEIIADIKLNRTFRKRKIEF